MIMFQTDHIQNDHRPPDTDSRVVRAQCDLPLVLKVEDLMPVLCIGRNTAYELVRSGQIRSIRVGRQLRIPRDAVMDYLDGKGA